MANSGNTKFIFVAGGVMSSVGKGVTAASIGTILQSRGFAVTALKIDPYVNVDAGTMNPTEHGEVFVLDDGMECDQDMGNYERFMNLNLSRGNYMTTGSIYLSVIQKERNLQYGGRCVNVVPDIPIEVIERIRDAAKKTKAEIVIIEIGGTVGDYQNVLFLEAVRMMKFENPEDVLLALVSHIPSLGAGGTELKTKPTQHAVRFLNGSGLQPDLLFARAKVPLDKKRKLKLEFMCGLSKGSIISAPDVETIYEIPLNFEKDALSDYLLRKFGLRGRGRDLAPWRRLQSKIKGARDRTKIAIVGKYFGTGRFVLTDSYISVLEAVKHAAFSLKLKPEIEWLDSEVFEKNPANLKELRKYHGVIIPGGFGRRGVEGKIAVIKYVRENKIPYLGLCYGMQLAVVEFARNVLGLKKAHTTEIDAKTPDPVIDILPEQKELVKEKKYGATMRLGAYPAVLKPNTIAQKAYSSSDIQYSKSKSQISERHRHRFEVNPDYIERLESGDLIFSGTSPDRRLMEITELPKSVHPFFLGSQFHPELKSRPLFPHPLFVAFVKSARQSSKTGK